MMKSLVIGCLLFVVLFCVSPTRAAKSIMKLSLLSTTCEIVKPEIMRYLTCFVEDSRFTAEFIFAKDILNAIARYSVIVERNNFKSLFVRGEENLCEWTKLKTNFIISTIKHEWKRVSNLPLQCPFKADQLFYARNLTVGTKQFPLYLPSANATIQVEYINNGQIIGRSSVLVALQTRIIK